LQSTIQEYQDKAFVNSDPGLLHLRYEQHIFDGGQRANMICPLLGGPKSMLFWTRKGKKNAIQETHAGGDYRQAA
jgi:hypothetical protein